MVYVSRTNIDLDDRLVEKVMQMYLLKTKREAVQLRSSAWSAGRR